jgi:uncharacterized membrane protein HdeD (DUF308 family)
MDLFLAISQGTGLALAIGVRPFLPPLLAGVLARADAGIDFSGTDFSFLESIPFLAAMLALTALVTMVGRRAQVFALARVLGAAAVALGALEFAGSLAEESYAGGPGLVAGAALALLGFLAAATFFEGARARLAARGESAPLSLLTVIADAASLVLATIAVFVGPVSYLPLVFSVWLLTAQRRRAARKYEGLRVLR